MAKIRHIRLRVENIMLREIDGVEILWILHNKKLKKQVIQLSLWQTALMGQRSNELPGLERRHYTSNTIR